MPRIFCALLFSCLLAPATLHAQTDSTQQNSDEQDLGTLQAELARVEAERQRLAEQLSASVDIQQVQRLEEENRVLREQQAEGELQARSQLEEQRQKWFMIGGGSVAGSLVLGYLLANLGGRRRQREWLN